MGGKEVRSLTWSRRLSGSALRVAEYLEIIDIYLGDSALDGIAILPGAIAQTTFYIKSGSLTDISFGYFGGSVPHYNIMPLCPARTFSTVGHPHGALVGGQRE